MNILAIETSCDETAAAVVSDGRRIIGQAVASSAALHQKYGGIVPEIAAREQLSSILPVITEALSPLTGIPTGPFPADAVDAIAVSAGPGLIGSLLIGVETAKAVAMATGKPVIPVNHVLAHMYANFLETGPEAPQILFPAVSLVVSGGHTELFLMENEQSLRWLGGTIDDAAGEAFDKTARLIGLGGGGGVAIQEAAARYDGNGPAIRLPRPMLHDDTLTFSFSGLKTAVMREWKAVASPDDSIRCAFASAIQEAITDVLVAKTINAASRHGAMSILLSGGVAANARLRLAMAEGLAEAGMGNIGLVTPPVRYCTDNAAYIASYAFFRGNPQDWKNVTAEPDMSVEVES